MMGGDKMTIRNLARRLERLEDELLPVEDRVVILHIQGVTPDRQVVRSLEFRVVVPSKPAKPRYW